MRRWVRFGLHPALLVGAWALWSAMEEPGLLLAIAIAYGVVVLCERWAPAQPEWVPTRAERASVIAVGLVALVVAGVIAVLYEDWIRDPLARVRSSAGLEIWPSGWPVLAQVLLVYFASELIYYWMHRGIHRYTLLWRASGHGFHHAYRNMHAAVFAATHPFELLLLALPATLIAGCLGAGFDVVTGAGVLQVVNALVAHANVDTSSAGIGLLFTTPGYHRAHHSNELAQSNTNFSCNAIVWDRLFGTFSDAPVQQTGVGLDEPSLLEKLLLPWREPRYVRTSPRAQRATSPSAGS